MRRDVAAILLLLLGGAVLRITLSGAYINYVKPGMQPYLLVSAAVLLLLGALAFWDSLRVRSDGGGALSLAADDHDHHHLRSPWLLVLPVAAIFLVAPGPLGAYTASREGSSVTAPRAGSQAAPLPAGDPVPLLLNDFAVRAVWDEGRTLEGRSVEVVGFAVPDAEGGWLLTRLSLACCAADALATKVRPVGDVPAVPENTWVSVTGRYVQGGGTRDAEAIPWIEVERMVQVPQPADPYM